MSSFKSKTTKQVRLPINRSVDAESRKPRVTLTKMYRRPPPQPENPEESDEQISSDVDSEIEDAEHMKVKDDSRRQTFTKRKARPQFKKDTATQEASHSKDETVSDEHDILAAPHMIMKAAVYHMKVAPITFPKVSNYVPSFYVLFCIK
jgi:hypothetical protein